MRACVIGWSASGWLLALALAVPVDAKGQWQDLGSCPDLASPAAAADSLIDVATGLAQALEPRPNVVGALLVDAAACFGLLDSLASQAELLSAGARHIREGGDYDRATALYRRAVDIERGLGDSAAMGIDLLNLGVVYGSLFAQTGVLHHLADGRAALREAEEIRLALGDGAGAARAALHLGDLSVSTREYDRGISEYRAAAARFKEAGDTVGWANGMMRIARLETRMGRFEDALSDYDAISRASANTLRQATIRAEMALVFGHRGWLTDARFYANWAKNNADDEDLPHTDVLGNARALVALAAVELSLGRPDSARGQLEKAAWYLNLSSNAPPGSVFQETSEEWTPVALAYLRTQGDLFLAESRPDSARERYEALYRAGERSAEITRRVGAVYLQLGDPATARQWLEQARDSATLGELSYVLTDLGTAYSQIGAFSDAQRALARAASVAEQLGMPHARAMAYLALARHHYRDEGDPDHLAKSVETYDVAVALTVARAGFTDAVTGVSLLEQYLAMYDEWVLASLAQPGLQERQAALAGLFAADGTRAQALARMTGVVPGRALRSGGRAPWQAGAVLDSLGTAAGTAYLYYMVTADTLLIWVNAPGDELLLVRTPIARASVARSVSKARLALGPVDDWDTCEQRGGGGPHEQHLEYLANLLLPDSVRDRLRDAHEVVIVPHGILAAVPFAALPTGTDEPPLGVSHALRFAPSLGWLARPTRRYDAEALATGAVFIADPVMPPIYDVCGLDVLRLRRLKQSGAWARSMAARLGGEAITANAATEAAALASAERASILHFGTHAQTYEQEGRALDSWLALAPEVPGGASRGIGDGFLRAREVGDGVALVADLVVLAACQSGLGDEKTAEGIVGLPWTFLAMGANSVLSSLWVVREEDTLRLMDAFYRHWLDRPPRPSKAEALRRARQELWQSMHPAAWAAFELVGGR